MSAEGYPSGQRGQTVNLLAYAFVGSNPTPSTTDKGRVLSWDVGRVSLEFDFGVGFLGARSGWFRRKVAGPARWFASRIGCGIGILVVHQPSKLEKGVRFPHPAPYASGASRWVEVERPDVDFRAHVAQSVEHVLGKDEVTGSIPVVGSSD